MKHLFLNTILLTKHNFFNAFLLSITTFIQLTYLIDRFCLALNL